MAALWGAIGARAVVYVWGFVHLTRKINRVIARLDAYLDGSAAKLSTE